MSKRRGSSVAVANEEPTRATPPPCRKPGAGQEERMEESTTHAPELDSPEGLDEHGTDQHERCNRGADGDHRGRPFDVLWGIPVDFSSETCVSAAHPQQGEHDQYAGPCAERLIRGEDHGAPECQAEREVARDHHNAQRAQPAELFTARHDSALDSNSLSSPAVRNAWHPCFGPRSSAEEIRAAREVVASRSSWSTLRREGALGVRGKIRSRPAFSAAGRPHADQRGVRVKQRASVRSWSR